VLTSFFMALGYNTSEAASLDSRKSWYDGALDAALLDTAAYVALVGD